MRGSRKENVGVVISNKMDKTLVVEVQRSTPHPKYGKIVKDHKRYLVHVPAEFAETAVVKSVVMIEEIVPMSKRKSWQVKAIVK